MDQHTNTPVSETTPTPPSPRRRLAAKKAGLLVSLVLLLLATLQPALSQTPPTKVYLPLVSNTVPAVTFAAPAVTKRADGGFLMVLTGSDGSAYTLDIVREGTDFYPKTVSIKPDPQLGIPPSTAHISPDGNRMEVQADGSPNLWIVQNENGAVRLKLKDSSGEREVMAFPITQTAQLAADTNTVASLCTSGRKFCEGVRNLNITGWIQVGVGLSGSIGLISLSGILGAFGLVSKAVDLTCILMFGSDQDAQDAIMGMVTGKVLGTYFRGAQARLLQISRNFVRSFPALPLGIKTSNVLSKFLSDQLWGKVEDMTKDGFVDFASPLNDWLLKSANLPKGSAMNTIRKNLGLDMCDVDYVTITCNGSYVSCEIPHGQSAKIQIVYNLTGRGESLEFHNTTVLPNDLEIPGHLNRRGVIDITFYNDEGGCYTIEHLFFVFLFSRNTIDNTRDTIISNDVHVNMKGNRENSIWHCTGSKKRDSWTGEGFDPPPTTTPGTAIPTATPMASNTPSPATPTLSPSPSATLAPATPTTSPVPSATPMVSPLPSATPTATATSLPPVQTWTYQDDFSNPASGWAVITNTTSELRYQNGAYEIRAFQPWLSLPSRAPYTVTGSGYTVEVDVRSSEGAAPAGLLFDWQDSNHFSYYALDARNGAYQILRMVNGAWTTLVPWTASSAIATGTATNTLRVVRTSTTVAVSINGQLLNTIAYSSIPIGQVGVLATAWEATLTTAQFDNFKLALIP